MTLAHRLSATEVQLKLTFIFRLLAIIFVNIYILTLRLEGLRFWGDHTFIIN